MDVLTALQEDVELELRNDLHWGVCPFCAPDRATLVVSPISDSWRCFGCNKGGDWLEWMRWKNEKSQAKK